MLTTQETIWLKSIISPAQDSQLYYKVPASVTLAQCILESGWGSTRLAKRCNNFFGIKAEHLDQPNTYEEFPTHEFMHGHEVVIDAAFEKYPDIDSSFRDHARLLSMASRYAPAMAVRTDPFEFANELQACGYSTAPNYGSKLGELIKDYDLTQYDRSN